MSTESHYVSNLDSMDWKVAQEFEAHFRWEYDDGRESLLNLYRKGKRQQWDSDSASTGRRISIRKTRPACRTR